MIPLYSAQQVRDADKYAINELKIPGIALMENASRSIYKTIRDEFTDIDQFNPIGIVCGKGNNGGDGFALGRHFINDGFSVILISIGRESDLKGDALTNYRILKNLLKQTDGSKLTTYKSIKDINSLIYCSVIVDAMLGTGAKGNLGEPYRSIINKLNEFDVWKVAVDLPTGLNIDTAEADVIFEADLTVTLAQLKSGLFYGMGYVNSGEIVKGYIGLGEEYFESLVVDNYLLEPEDAYFSLPVKELNAHKYSTGKVFVIAGSGSLPGAAFFTSNSVLRSGGGASILAFPNSIKTLAQSKLDGATVSSYRDEGKEFLTSKNITELTDRIKWADVIVIGPGLGREKETLDAVNELLDKFKSKKFVIDADAIFALRNGKYKKLNLKNKILTPHHKEFSDMIGVDIEKLEKNTIELGKKFVKETGSYLVLKGAPTIIFTKDEEVIINSSGNPGMAKFGTGDVLSGVIGGMLAQSGDPERALLSAVYLHGLSADLLIEDKTEYSITASDIMENLPNAIRFLEDSIVQSI
ncbi:NAD(P)H-hydrate dehydratase [Bacteroidota bacterium]